MTDFPIDSSLRRLIDRAIRLFLSLSKGLVVGLGERSTLTLLSVLNICDASVSFPNPSNLVFLCSDESTHLPLGETEVHLTTALGVQAGSLLQRAAHGTGGNGEVAVVTGNRNEQMVRNSR